MLLTIAIYLLLLLFVSLLGYRKGIQKFIFAMGAGVGPVFILRWFWWRINAWSQFSAMLSSLVYAISWDLLYAKVPHFTASVQSIVTELNLSPYAFKLICLTTLVSITWLVVTFLTKPDDEQTLDEFYDRSVKLILSAEEPVHSLYQGERLAFDFQRAISRLQEMQSTAYLAKEHRP